MFELTNEQRKCFAIPPILDNWKKIEVKAGRYDNFITYAYLNGEEIVKVILVSDIPGCEIYKEYCVEEKLSADGTKILPKTDKGKPQNFTSANLLKKAPVGMTLSFNRGYVDIVNNTSKQCFYYSAYNAEKPQTIKDFAQWVDNWCQNTKEKELTEINDFSKRAKSHQKYKEGDFFRYRIKRNLYGYGRILVDYDKMRKDGIEFWDVFMGKPLCVEIYHIATDDANIPHEQLVHLKALPSQMIMDNIFYYGECKIIGNIPISSDEDNYTIHYGRSINARKPNFLYYQFGKTCVALKDAEELRLHGDVALGDFSKKGIGFRLDITLPILLECIKKNSNGPYWNMIPACRANEDLRNPKFKKVLKQIKKQMGIE